MTETGQSEDVTEHPKYCETDGCYRTPDVLLFIGIAESTLDPADDERRWKCEPCHIAMREGNRLAGGNIRKIRSLNTATDQQEGEP